MMDPHKISYSRHIMEYVYTQVSRNTQEDWGYPGQEISIGIRGLQNHPIGKWSRDSLISMLYIREQLRTVRRVTNTIPL